MALIRCNDCGKEISDTTKNCIHCGCPVTIQHNNQLENTVKEYLKKESTTLDNINSIFLIAKILKWLFRIGYIVLAIILLMSLLYGEEVPFFICLFGIVNLLILSFVSTTFIEWKAHLLKNIYELNTKKR